MKQIVFLLVVVVLTSQSCHNKQRPLFEVSQVSPWCIIGFDSLDRTPEQRIAMLEEMGFTKYGFNKGKGDLTTMKREFQLAKEHEIEIPSVFLWLNAKRDSVGTLSAANLELLTNLKEIDQKPTLWVSFSDNFYKNTSHEEAVKLSIDMIRYVQTQASQIGCEIALYNHHGWFGNPYHQLEILERIKDPKLTMVYNFHHAQEYVDQFPDIAHKIVPYLSYVNLNGVKKEGPQIIPIGQGNFELQMVQTLLDEGYTGPWGILGHIKTEDVKKVLQENIDGMHLLNDQLKR